MEALDKPVSTECMKRQMAATPSFRLGHCCHISFRNGGDVSHLHLGNAAGALPHSLLVTANPYYNPYCCNHTKGTKVNWERNNPKRARGKSELGG